MLLRGGEGGWTTSQLERLPDGIRQSQAKHVLLEFKYSESLNLDTLIQAIMSYALYIRANKLKEDEVAFFVVLSHQPQSSVLDHFGYHPIELAGLYHSTQPTLSNISLMLLNELPPTPNNAFIKCFASQKRQQKAAFEQVKQNPLLKGNEALRALLFGLLNLLFPNGGKLMENETITPEKLQKAGQQLMEAWLKFMPPAERMAGLRPAERVAGLRPADLLSVISPTELLADLRPAERMAGLSQAEIEDYLAQLKAQNDLALAD